MKALVAPLLAEAVRAGRRGGRPVRFAALVGAVLIIVGVLHGIAFLALGGPWQGPVAWRKPFAFGLSFGLTTITIGWVVSRLRVGPAVRWWLLVPVAASATVEVAWVTTQRARGVASHFNDASPADALAFAVAGGGAIAVMVTALLVVAVLTWVRPDAPAALRSALRSGLAILLLAQAVGGWMIERGNESVAAGGPASHAIGEAGDLKIVHALGMHAVQVIPVIALWLTAGALDEVLSRTLVRAAAAGYALVTAAALAQAVAGRPVTDPSAAALVPAVVGTGVLLLVGGLAARAVRRRSPAEGASSVASGRMAP